MWPLHLLFQEDRKQVAQHPKLDIFFEMARIGVALTPITDDNYKASTADGTKIGDIPIAEGAFEVLPENVKRFVAEKTLLMTPNNVFIVDGSEQQMATLKKSMVDEKMMVQLKAYDDNWLVRTDPKDVARMEDATWIVTADKFETECHTSDGVKALFGHWMDPNQCSDELDARFPKCMAGRTLYVIPFSLGAPGGPQAMFAVMLTDSAYIVLLMCIMTRVSPDVWLSIGEDGQYTSCIHSVGVPLPAQMQIQNNWPCNVEKALIVHRMKEQEVWSFGSAYGGNALVSKKSLALRIASTRAHKNGWLAEHMLVMGVTPPGGEEVFIAAALPSGSGKTNLALMKPAIKGWRVRCLGCDVAWFSFGLDNRLYGYNPENGIFATAPGTNSKTNPHAIITIHKNTIFTNVAETDDGEYFWEGLEQDLKNAAVEMTNWQGQKWKVGDQGSAAHPNARYCAPFHQIPNIHPEWDTANGVPISAIVFGARRSSGMPLVIESFSWKHGIFIGASLRSESTCAMGRAEFKVEHDPMAMGPFVGYNMGKYLQHWLDMDDLGHKVPKIFYVNFFRKNADGKYIWPGFGQNIRVLEWILKRIGGGRTTIARTTAIGDIPIENSINCAGLPKIDMAELLSVQKNFWLEEMKETRQFFEQQIGSDMPEAIMKELEDQEKRINEI